MESLVERSAEILRTIESLEPEIKALYEEAHEKIDLLQSLGVFGLLRDSKESIQKVATHLLLVHTRLEVLAQNFEALEPKKAEL